MQYLFREYCGRQPETPDALKLTVGEVNHYLDQLAGDEANDGKVRVLRDLLQVTTPNQMKWIIQILLRDLKVYSAPSFTSEPAVFVVVKLWQSQQDCRRQPLLETATLSMTLLEDIFSRRRSACKSQSMQASSQCSELVCCKLREKDGS